MPTLSNISFSVNQVCKISVCSIGLNYRLLCFQENHLLAVVGPVGSGKVCHLVIVVVVVVIVKLTIII